MWYISGNVADLCNMAENSVPPAKDEESEIIEDNSLDVSVHTYSEIDLEQTSNDVDRLLSGESISSNGHEGPVFPTDPSHSHQTDIYTSSAMIADPHTASGSPQAADPALPVTDLPELTELEDLPDLPDLPEPLPAQDTPDKGLVQQPASNQPQQPQRDGPDLDFLPLDNLGDLDPANLPDPLSLFDFENNQNAEANSEETERERMKLLISYFDEQQMARYLAFRRANIRRAAVRKYASQLLNQPVSNNVAMVLAGMSKVLIGDIIELAREIQDKNQGREKNANPVEGQEPDPLLPQSIREAWKICSRDITGIPGSRTRPGSANRFF